MQYYTEVKYLLNDVGEPVLMVHGGAKDLMISRLYPFLVGSINNEARKQITYVSMIFKFEIEKRYLTIIIIGKLTFQLSNVRREYDSTQSRCGHNF